MTAVLRPHTTAAATRSHRVSCQSMSVMGGWGGEQRLKLPARCCRFAAPEGGRG
jgi:hypothetical protein